MWFNRVFDYSLDPGQMDLVSSELGTKRGGDSRGTGQRERRGSRVDQSDGIGERRALSG